MLRRWRKSISNEKKEVRERDTELKDIDKAIKPFQNKSGNDERRLATILMKNLGKKKNSRFHVVGVDNLYLRKERYGGYLNSYDYKIFTKTIATIIQSSQEDITDSEQTAAIRGKTIIENLHFNFNAKEFWNIIMIFLNAYSPSSFVKWLYSFLQAFFLHAFILYVEFLFCLLHL